MPSRILQSVAMIRFVIGISGGGYCSTGDAPRNVCANDKSNNPQVPAKALYDSIAGFTRKGFEALGLVSNFIFECFNEE